MSSSRDYIAGNRAVVPAKPRKSKLGRLLYDLPESAARE